MIDTHGRVGRLTASALATAGRLLFPPVCTGCARQVSQPGSLCANCWKGLHFLERPWCAVLGTPLPYEMGEGAVSPEAIADPPPFDRARAAVSYTGAARRMVQDLKYRDHTDRAPWMAQWMVRAGAELIADADLVVPVPLHWRRFFGRRFNQSAELARAVAAQTGVAFAPLAVTRVKVTRQQVGLGVAERQTNVRAAFSVSAAWAARMKGRRVLLIDDVYTTGATVSAVARTLRKSGAAAVDVLTFARVLKGDFQPLD